jgi:hypothetical protein
VRPPTAGCGHCGCSWPSNPFVIRHLSKWWRSICSTKTRLTLRVISRIISASAQVPSKGENLPTAQFASSHKSNASPSTKINPHLLPTECARAVPLDFTKPEFVRTAATGARLDRAPSPLWPLWVEWHQDVKSAGYGPVLSVCKCRILTSE